MNNDEKKFADNIISIVAGFFSISQKDIFRQIRKKEIVEVRHIVSYCLRLMTKMSFPQIGKLLGRDHTTIMHSCSKTAAKIEKDKKFENIIQGLLTSIRNLDGGVEMDLQSEEIPAEKDETEVGREEKAEKMYKIPTRDLELNARQKIVLDYYRQGKDLKEISELIGVTRERSRQILEKAMLKEVGAKIEAGFEIDISEYLRGEKINNKMAKNYIPKEEKDKFLQEHLPKAKSYISIQSFAHDIGISASKLIKKFPEITAVIERNIQEKKNRWSRFYIKCRGCGTTIIPHARNGYCENCSGTRSKKTRRTLLNQDSLCSVCSMKRGEAISKYGRDLYILKNGKVLCRGCFLQLTGSKLASSRRDR